MPNSKNTIHPLRIIPGVGKSISQNLIDIGISSISDLNGKNPKELYDISNKYIGSIQDPCLLYVFRADVYYANDGRNEEKLKWWNWKNDTSLDT